MLLLHSIFSTSFVGEIFLEDGSEQERTLNIADSPLKHLLVFLFLTALILAVRKLWDVFGGGKENRSGIYGRKGHKTLRGDLVFWGFLALTLVLGAAYVGMTQLYPGSDPAKVFKIAMEWRQGDFSSFEEEAYLFCYPFQAGIVLFFYLLSFPLGMDNYVGLQLVNVICLAVIYGLMTKISGLFGLSGDEGLSGFGKKGRGMQRAVYLGLLIWVPLFFYVTYLYGILPGMALSLGAVYFALLYLSTRRYRYIAAASLCMGLATVIKMNCLIYLIAIACFLVYDAIDLFFFQRDRRAGKWAASLVFIACMGLSVVFCTHLSNSLVERITGEKLGEGEVMLSWVVMGMQEAPLGPGGYNGYISNVFTEYHYDTEQVTQASFQELRNIVTQMSENPLDEGIPFFARKTAFQWNDPTFISLDRTRGRKAAVKMPLWLKSLIEGKGSVRLSVFLNYVQTWILLGMLFYLFLRWQGGSLYELMGAVIFLGGYLFHMFWESSASYTIPYFVQLIPYAVCGMAEWVTLVEKGIDRLWKKKDMGAEQASAGSAGRGKKKIRRAVKGILALVICLLVFAFTRTNLFDRTVALDDDRTGIDASAQFYQTGIWEKSY